MNQKQSSINLFDWWQYLLQVHRSMLGLIHFFFCFEAKKCRATNKWTQKSLKKKKSVVTNGAHAKDQTTQNSNTFINDSFCCCCWFAFCHWWMSFFHLRIQSLKISIKINIIDNKHGLLVLIFTFWLRSISTRHNRMMGWHAIPLHFGNGKCCRLYSINMRLKKCTQHDWKANHCSIHINILQPFGFQFKIDRQSIQVTEKIDITNKRKKNVRINRYTYRAKQSIVIETNWVSSLCVCTLCYMLVCLGLICMRYAFVPLNI